MDRQNRYYSNRVRTARKERLDAKRREYLNLANAEPNLGYPVSLGNPEIQPFPELDHVLVGREDGTKEWTQRPEGLKIDGDLSQILNKHRFEQGYVPTTEDLEFGEILINAYDSKLFIKRLVDGVQSISEIETGLQGPQGVQGVQGIQGERQPFIPVQIIGDAENVNGTFPGPGGPNDPEGYLEYYYPAPELGDAVFDLATSDLWVWAGSTWFNAGLLRGPQGVQGTQGLQGVQGRNGIQGPFGLQGPRGFAGPQGIQGLQGPQGIQGRIGRSLRLLGTVDTTAEIPGYPNSADPGTEVGDAYIVRSDRNIYIWNGTNWFNGGQILIQGTQGIQGPQGVQGPQGLQGYPLDVIDNYADPLIPLNSAYLQETYPDANPFSGVVDISSGNGVLWQRKDSGEWEEVGVVSVQGPQGPQGLQGPQSAQGTQGLQGPQGIQGRYGPATEVIATYNDPLEPLSSELLNDLHPFAEWLNVVVDITSGNGVMWQKNLSGTWDEIGIISVQGVQGLQGIQGLQGPQGLQGLQGEDFELFISDTPPLDPKIGDGWLDTTTGIRYTWIADGDSAQWVELPTAAQGVQGLRGQDYNLTIGPTPPENPLIGDQWLDANSGTLYTWTYDGDSYQWVELLPSLQGTQGIQGISVQGVQGTLGLQGFQGIQGIQGLQGTLGLQGLQGIQGPKTLFQRRFDYVAPYSYCGLAPVDAAESDAVWEITRIETNSEGIVIATLSASNVAWTNRLTAIYS